MGAISLSAADVGDRRGSPRANPAETVGGAADFDIPRELTDYVAELDARTDWDAGGTPSADWEARTRWRADAVFGPEGRGLAVVRHFFNENRIRQAASSLGAAQFCIDRSVAYAKQRKPFGKPLADNQAIQFPWLNCTPSARCCAR